MALQRKRRRLVSHLELQNESRCIDRYRKHDGAFFRTMGIYQITQIISRCSRNVINEQAKVTVSKVGRQRSCIRHPHDHWERVQVRP